MKRLLRVYGLVVSIGCMLAVAQGPPVIVKQFVTPTIPLNGITGLVIVVANPNADNTLTGVGFTDTLPAGLIVDTPSQLTTENCGGTVTASGSNISYSGGTLNKPPPPANVCKITLAIKGTTVGVKHNVTSAPTSNEGGTGTAASADVTVVSPPTLTKNFGAAQIPLDGSTTLHFVITNTSSLSALTQVAFADPLPGFQVANPNGLTGNCTGTITATPGTQQITLANGTLPVSGSCNFTVTVKPIAAGTFTDQTTPIASQEGGIGLATTAVIKVVAPPVINKQFITATVPLNGITAMVLAVANPNPTTNLTNIAFTDPLPAGLVVATPNSLTNGCGGTVTAVEGSGLISVSGVNLPTSANVCVITLALTGTTAGVKNNSTTAPTSTEGGAGAPGTASITVVAPPTISKSFPTPTMPLNTTTTLTIKINNPNPTVALTGIQFADVLPAGLAVTTPGNTTACVTGTLQTTANVIVLTGGTIAPSATCTIDITVTGIVKGVQNNQTTIVLSVEGGPGPASNVASIIVVAPPDTTKSFDAVAAPLGVPFHVTFSITNPNDTVPLTGIGFVDTLPGMVVANPNGVTGSCVPISTITAVPGSSTITIAGLTLPITTTCTFTVTVIGVSEGRQNNTTGPVASVEGGNGAPGTASVFVGTAYQVNYTSNLNVGESHVNVTNTGLNGAPLLGPGFGSNVGNICLNVYGFSPDEQLISCCSCLVTPNGLANLGVNRDLTGQTLTGVVPTSTVLKLVTTLAGGDGTGTSCSNSAAVVTAASIAGGGLAWRTTLHPDATGGAPYHTTETRFVPSTLSQGELSSISGRCASLLGNGSGAGICRACQPGALGSAKM